MPQLPHDLRSAGGYLVRKATTHPYIAGGLLLVGGGLAYGLVRTLRNSTAPPRDIAQDVHIELSVMVNRSAAELFGFWRNFENLPLFMNNLESVEILDNTHSHWTAKGIAGLRVEWDAEIYNEKENEFISWRSVGDAGLVNAGSVWFRPVNDGLPTIVSVTMNYNRPAGKLGESIAQALGVEPMDLIREDLQRFKQIMEGAMARSNNAG